MSQEQEQNRTEKATPFKLSEARKRGQVAKSLDFNSLVAVWGLLGVLSIWGASAWLDFIHLSENLLIQSAAASQDAWSLNGTPGSIMREVAGILGPFLAVGMVLSILANLVQTGPIFSFEPLQPKFERLNPVAGFKRVFNKQMLFQAFKSILKLAFFAVVAYGFFTALWPELPALESIDLGGQMAWLERNGTALLSRLALALLLVGVLDLAFVRWQFARQMMMSRREMKEEIKRREGDPQIKAKARELRRENLKQSRSMGRVQDADVLITNPQHFAVALRYVRGQMSAPYVIAKGSDAWVVEMKALARRHSVPIYERKSLARQLFQFGEVDRPVPPDTFVDVARVYADIEAGSRHQQNLYEVST